MEWSLSNFEDMVSAIDNIERTKDKIDLLVVLSKYLKQFGVSNTTLGVIVNPSLLSEDVTDLGVSDFPAEYLERYFTQSFVGHDPVLQYASRSKVAFTWQDAYEYAKKYERRILEISTDYGMSEGFTVPIFTPHSPPGMVSMATDDADLSLNSLSLIELPIQHAFMHLLTLLNIPFPEDGPELSKREVDIMHWVAAGKSNWEIGKILGISEHTVKKAMSNSMLKLGASSRAHAVSLSIRRGVILP